VRSAVGICVTALAGCEVLFPLGPPAGTDGRTPDAAVDADPTAPDAPPPVPFCMQAPWAFCADFEDPTTGIGQFIVAQPLPGSVVEELPPDGIADTRTLRAALPIDIDGTQASYAVATVAFFEPGLSRRVRLRLRAGQATGPMTCQPDVVQLWLGPNREVQAALQAVGDPSPGYRLRLTDNGGGVITTEVFVGDPAQWRDVELVVNVAGSQVHALINGTSHALDAPAVMTYGNIGPIELHVGTALVGAHEACELRFDEITLENLP
jgi:hypothetical protein